MPWMSGVRSKSMKFVKKVKFSEKGCDKSMTKCLLRNKPLT